MRQGNEGAVLFSLGKEAADWGRQDFVRFCVCKMVLILFLVASACFVSVVTAGLIPASDKPCDLGGLQVTYRDEQYDCGKQVSLDVFSNNKPPVDVTLDGNTSEDSEYYTLVMVDPDAPSSAGRAYWLHWLVTNIEGDTFASGYRGTGSGIMDYARPSPPKGNPHRYQFFAYKQPGKFSHGDITAPQGIGNFDLVAFQLEYNLGNPVAGYQILTQKV